MNTISIPRTEGGPASMDAGINALLAEAKAGVRCRYQACERGIRHAPVRSVLGAVAAGYCLHRLPLKALMVANVRLVAALAPPALLFYGAAKVYEYLQKQGCAARRVGDHPMEDGV